MGKHRYDGNGKAIEAADNILHFVDCMDTYLIPVGKSAKKIKKASKEIRKLIKDYKKGKAEIFTADFYNMIDEDWDEYQDL